MKNLAARGAHKQTKITKWAGKIYEGMNKLGLFNHHITCAAQVTPIFVILTSINNLLRNLLKIKVHSERL